MWHVLRTGPSLGFILAFLFSLVLAHRDAIIVLCKFKQPFLRLVEAHTFCLVCDDQLSFYSPRALSFRHRGL